MQRGARRVIAIHKCSVVLNIQMKSGCAWMFVFRIMWLLLLLLLLEHRFCSQVLCCVLYWETHKQCTTESTKGPNSRWEIEERPREQIQ